jgi:hypothetical protein
VGQMPNSVSVCVRCNKGTWHGNHCCRVDGGGWRFVFVSVMKSLWSSIQGDPIFMRRVNGWLTIFWIAMIPITLVAGWFDSVTYIAALSLWALVSGHWAAWQAARVEVEQQREVDERAKHPPEERIVEKLVETTTLEPLDDAQTSAR